MSNVQQLIGFYPDTPSFLGEWWLEPLSGTFSFTDQASARTFGDAQKRGYSPEGGNGGFGWYFWSWKMTNSVSRYASSLSSRDGELNFCLESQDSDGSNTLRSYKDAVANGCMCLNAVTYGVHFKLTCPSSLDLPNPANSYFNSNVCS